MKYGLYYYKNTHNIGDDIWAYAQSLFCPHIDYLIDNTKIYKFKSDHNESVAVIIAAFVEPYNHEYAFMPPTSLIPLFTGTYFRPTMWEFLQNDTVKQYLKAFEPIGCRTREQAKMLCEMGTDAYFSGCITLTLPYMDKPTGEYICCVDVPEDIVAFVKERVGGEFEVKVMSHEVLNVTEHSNLNIFERFDIVKNYLEIYAGAHCVVTSRLHAALPCLTQKTPVLLTTTRESAIGVNDIQSRLMDFIPLLHHCFFDDFQNNEVDYDFIDPPKNPEDYLGFQKSLTEQCTDFIRKCETGDMISKCPYTDCQRTESLTDILQNKILQLKGLVDKKNALLMQRRQQIIQLQKRLLAYESFNVWEEIEYFGDWAGRSHEMSKYIMPECRSLLDLGCGEMHVKRYLNPMILYFGCDYMKRDDATIVCDLAIGEFPEIHVDTIFIAGLLEYIGNWKAILKQCSEHCKQIVMSYSTTEAASVRDPIWINALSASEITNFLTELGFVLQNTEVYNTSAIFNFIKNLEE